MFCCYKSVCLHSPLLEPAPGDTNSIVLEYICYKSGVYGVAPLIDQHAVCLRWSEVQWAADSDKIISKA